MTLNSIIANFQTFKLADLLDIVIIAFLIYQLLGIINRTRAGQLAKGAVDNAQQLVDQKRDDDDIQQIDNFKGLKIGDDRIQCHESVCPLTLLRSGQQRGRQCPVPRR